ncbi:MAG: NADH-quinone oxidoreductase subunit K [Chloroflexi bacterium]|nr:NADH-quinone oxidoreductase subunit K [Chloroflexota bacterium]
MDLTASWLDLWNPFLSLALLAIGLACMLTRRRVIKQLIGLNIMLQGALLNLVDAGRVHGDLETPQGLVVSALVAETMVTAIALALIVNVFRYHPEGLVDDLDSLKG